MDGAQIYRNACTKARIIAQREQRAFRRGEMDWLPCSGDTQRAEIIKAFDRLLGNRSPQAVSENGNVQGGRDARPARET